MGRSARYWLLIRCSALDGSTARVRLEQARDDRLATPFEFVLGSKPIEAVVNSVCQHLVLRRAVAFRQAIGDTPADCVAGSLSAALPSEQNERQIRERTSNGLREVQAVRPRHPVVARDTVGTVRFQAGEPVRCGRFRQGIESVVFTLETCSDELTELGSATDIRDGHYVFPAHTRGRARNETPYQVT